MSFWNKRKYLTEEELNQGLGSDNYYQRILIVDELLQRDLLVNVNLLSRWMNVLKTEDLIKLESGWDQLSLAIYLKVTETLENRAEPSRWFGQNKGEEPKSISIQKIQHGLVETVWRKPWKGWKKTEDIQNQLRDPKYLAVEVMPEVIKEEELIVTPSKSSYITEGIVSIVSLPFWIIMTIVACTQAFSSVSGPGLPIAFCLFMVVMSIPVAVGMFLKAEWAKKVYLVTGVLALMWFGSKWWVEGRSVMWIALFVVQAVMLLPFAFKYLKDEGKSFGIG
ncbi:MAG: hypothetical protein HRT74_09045 [Flavobacteriales bacterium]|nr:hypothetical protein [Flavobacteriales bacterium]